VGSNPSFVSQLRPFQIIKKKYNKILRENSSKVRINVSKTFDGGSNPSFPGTVKIINDLVPLTKKKQYILSLVLIFYNFSTPK
jgi:hypothetical protein